MSQLEKERVKKLQEKGYKWQIITSVTYGGIEQRWLIVESEARKSSDSEKLENKIEQENVLDSMGYNFSFWKLGSFN